MRATEWGFLLTLTLMGAISMTIYTKICSVCKITKPTTDFSACKANKDGLQNKCRSCDKAYRQANKDHRKEQAKEYYQLNKERIQEYNQLNKERRKEYNKEYNQLNKDRLKERRREYDVTNKERIKQRHRQYYLSNKERIDKRNEEYYRQKRVSDPLYALTQRVRCLVGQAFRGNNFSKNSRTHEILGCSLEEFKIHIESQFVAGMSWENRSEWHLDHITPVSWGKTEEEIIALNHYTNFQPLWADENIAKGNRYSSK